MAPVFFEPISGRYTIQGPVVFCLHIPDKPATACFIVNNSLTLASHPGNTDFLILHCNY